MSPRTTEQNEEIRKERREQILNSALKLFAEHGFEATSISRIAKDARVAKGLIYNYFESKEELMEQIVYSTMEKMVGLYTILKDQQDPQATIRNILYYLRDTLKKDLPFWKMYIRFGSQLTEKQEFLQKFAAEMQDWMTNMHSLMEKLGFKNPQLEMMKFNAITDGISHSYVLMPDSYPLDEMIDYVVETYQNKDKL